MTTENNTARPSDLVWKVLTLRDKGRGHYYRYFITGEIWDAGKLHSTFAWNVPDLDNPNYDTSEAVRSEG